MFSFARVPLLVVAIVVFAIGCNQATPGPGAAEGPSISAGDYHSLSLDSAGDAWGWGYNSYGQVGDGSTTHRDIPTAIVTPPDVAFEVVAAGDYHSVAIDRNGNAWAWGENTSGELGDGTTTNRTAPAAVVMPSNTSFIAIAAGYHHSLAVDQDGNAWAWGNNGDGQFGDGTTAHSLTPTPASMPPGVRFAVVAAGEYHSVALDQDGDAWSWGYNGYGQLGDGTTMARLVPTEASMPPNNAFTSIDANSDQTVALDASGNAWAWGYNVYGQLGNGTTTDSATPSVVTMPPNTVFTKVVAGAFHTAAIDQNGNAWGWGRNNQGQLGDGTTADATMPSVAAMPPNTTFRVIDTGYLHTVAVDQNDNVWGWGYNGDGQLGDGTTTDRTEPTPAVMP